MNKKYFFNNTIIVLIFFWLGYGYSQELPPIVKYSPSPYAAGNQNWMISQDENHFLFFANNEGLLEFNGSNWTLYPSPNETIIRSVKVIDDKIFTGCYMEFGYWKRQPSGQLKYTSLSTTIKHKILDDEQFWNILKYDQWVLFQSLNRIYIYDTKTKKFTIIAPKNGVVKSFATKNAIYFQTLKEGLFEIQDASSQLVAAALEVEPGMRVIDTCAGAGGKSLHIAALMENKGQIIATDIYESKLRKLKIRTRRAGVFNITTKEIDSPKVMKKMKGTADRVLIDAPCSGIGVLRRNPDSKWKLEPEFVENIIKTQAEILENYSQLVKPGGKLVYATCSIFPSENEKQVHGFLKNHPEFGSF